MDELRGIFEGLKFKEVETFIASGNVMFTADAPKSPRARPGASGARTGTGDPALRAGRPDEELAATIAARLKKLLGYDVATFVRSTEEMQDLAAYQAWPAAKLKDAVARNVAFIGAPLDAEAVKRVAAIETEWEEFHPHGREIHCLSRRKLSETTITTKAFERAVGGPASWRNVNTVAKIAARLAAHSA
jgi:uncharacterized protein (DUF1697 family)